MSAFDTYTNTGSTTFTNAYGTIDLLPSGSVQYAKGFQRTYGWRYFEFVVDDAGGDSTKLLMGYNMAPLAETSAVMWGSDSKQAYLTSGVIDPNPYLVFPVSITAETGDVFMFAIDMTGQNRDHAGTPFSTATLSSGTGEILTPAFGEVGKNGVWSGGGLFGWAWPSHGYPMQARPVVARDSTSAAAATVSLRVVTTSFAYPIPAGMVAWGDGPEGGTVPSISYTIAWDPTRIFGQFSLSASNKVAVEGAITGYAWVYSTPLPTIGAGAGLRVVEFLWGANSLYYTNLKVGLVDANWNTSITSAGAQPGSISSTAFYWFGLSHRCVAPTSITNSNMFKGYTSAFGMQYVVDHDTQRIWGKGIFNGAAVSHWAGAAGGTERTSPYKSGGTDGVTITDSVGFRWAASSDSTSLSAVEINTGQKPFIYYPLMPGIKSLDGTRQVYGVGDTWQTGLTPSVSYSHSNLGVASSNLAVNHVGSSGSKSTGRQFYQVYHGVFASGWSGLRPAAMTTLSVAAHTKNNLVWNTRENNPLLSRYSITTTGTFTGFGTHWQGHCAFWESVAVDFDAGKIWFGLLDLETRQNVYVNGGNPAAGTGEAMTFTANTNLRIFTWLDPALSNKTTILVAETNNVVDMPDGFTAWNGSGSETSATATPSGTVPAGGGRVLWPYGVQT